MSVKTVLNVAQMFVELHLVSPALGNDLQDHPGSLEMALIDRQYDTSLLVVCSNNVSISCHFFDIPLLRRMWLSVGRLILKSLSFLENRCD